MNKRKQIFQLIYQKWQDGKITAESKDMLDRELPAYMYMTLLGKMHIYDISRYDGRTVLKICSKPHNAKYDLKLIRFFKA